MRQYGHTSGTPLGVPIVPAEAERQVVLPLILATRLGEGGGYNALSTHRSGRDGDVCLYTGRMKALVNRAGGASLTGA